MLAQDESPATATKPAGVTSQKLLQLLRKRFRQLIRAALVFAVCLVLGGAAFAIWWITSLNGLPDFGEPFDVAAFRAHSVRDEQNAFTFLRRADEALTSFPSNAAVSWSQADVKLRKWVETNRQALDLFQRGAEQSDAAHPAGNPTVNGTRVTGLALLEGSKRQESGDTSGAWDCYRAVLRMTAHIRRRGSLHQRFDVNTYWSGWLRQRLATWAADPRTTIRQIRTALEAVQESEPRPEWDAFALKGGYLEILRSLERPVSPVILQDIGWEYTGRLDDMQLSPGMINYVDGARRFLLREPERSRRVLRFLCANWLAHVETLELRQQKPAVRASFSVLTSTNPVRTGTISVLLYPVNSRAAAGARPISPEELAGWLVATDDAKLRILVANSFGWPWPPDRLMERRVHRDLVIMLAEEIYRRERGSVVPSENALVGTYLKSLPDDGSADVDDGAAPTIQ
jgi:hypothetical protein